MKISIRSGLLLLCLMASACSVGISTSSKKSTGKSRDSKNHQKQENPYVGEFILVEGQEKILGRLHEVYSGLSIKSDGGIFDVSILPGQQMVQSEKIAQIKSFEGETLIAPLQLTQKKIQELRSTTAPSTYVEELLASHLTLVAKDGYLFVNLINQKTGQVDEAVTYKRASLEEVRQAQLKAFNYDQKRQEIWEQVTNHLRNRKYTLVKVVFTVRKNIDDWQEVDTIPASEIKEEEERTLGDLDQKMVRVKSFKVIGRDQVLVNDKYQLKLDIDIDSQEKPILRIWQDFQKPDSNLGIPILNGNLSEVENGVIVDVKTGQFGQRHYYKTEE